MDVVQGTFENGVLNISLSGHVDSNNATTVEADIQTLCDKYGKENIVIDAADLTYISSAGLRILLRLRKSSKDMKVVNVTSEVYEVFEMTGFTEIIPIEKAYRRLSVKGCEVIGHGANGIVYRLDPDTIVKVYLQPDCLDEIHNEREMARKAFVLGIPTAIPYDVVKVDDKYGSVFELLNAQSFSKLISTHPKDIMKYIHLYVDLLKKIHSTVVKPGDLPDMNKTAIGWVNYLKDKLPSDQWEKLYALISAIPEDLHMLHGDYHTKNIMMQNGEVLLIDMDTLAAGSPVYEFSFMYNSYIGYEETLSPEEKGKFLGLTTEQQEMIWTETLKEYFGTDDPKKLDEITQKARIISYTRILRRTLRRTPDTEEGKKCIANCRTHLAELLPKVDSLVL